MPRVREKGYVTVTVAILLVVIVGFAALAVDSGVLYSSRTSAQSIADAAALAAASTLILNPTDQPARAESYAREHAVGRQILGGTIQGSEVDVNVDMVNQLIRVRIDRNENTFLAAALGMDQAAVGATAFAEAGLSSMGSDCAKPWFLPNTVLLPAGAIPCEVCDPTSPNYADYKSQLLIDNGQVTSFARRSASQGGAIGRIFTVKPQRPQNALQPGQFYAIQLGGSGADVYRNNIGQCAPVPVGCTDCYAVESGDMVGPTSQGVRDLRGADPDHYQDVGCYGPDCSDISDQLVTIPIWEVCERTDGACPSADFCPNGFFNPGGATIRVKVKGFALVFVVGMVGTDVRVRLINIWTCGPRPATIPASNVFSVPLRLVSPPQADG